MVNSQRGKVDLQGCPSPLSIRSSARFRLIPHFDDGDAAKRIRRVASHSTLADDASGEDSTLLARRVVIATLSSDGSGEHLRTPEAYEPLAEAAFHMHTEMSAPTFLGVSHSLCVLDRTNRQR
jgi:hypothetical protein